MGVGTVSPVVRFRSALVAACRAVGIDEEEIVVERNALKMPDAGITVVMTLSDGHRVWRAEESHFVRSIGEDEGRWYSTVLFEDSIGRELYLAKRLAMKVAEGRIDVALDAAAV